MWLSNLRFEAQFTLFTFITAAIFSRRDAKPILRVRRPILLRHAFMEHWPSAI
jgi:hypothetical protein